MKKFLGIFFALIVFSGTLFFLFRSFNVVQKTKKAVVTPGEKVNYVHVDYGDRKLFPNFEEVSEFIPKSVVRHTAVKDGSLVFDFTYKVDRWGFRQEPYFFTNTSKHFFVSGCSIPFGIGVNENDTISSMLARKMKGYHTVNLGQPGGGLHTQLRVLDYLNLKELAPEESGIYFYIFFDDHFYRWSNAATYVMWARENKITYQMKSGHLQPIILKKTKEFQEMQKAKKAGLEESYLRLNHPGEWTEKEMHSFISGVKLLRSKYLKTYPKGRFVFALFPMVLTTPHLDRLVEKIKEEKIDVFDMRKNMADFAVKNKKELSDFKVPMDGHPNPYFNNLFTDFIVKELNI